MKDRFWLVALTGKSMWYFDAVVIAPTKADAIRVAKIKFKKRFCFLKPISWNILRSRVCETTYAGEKINGVIATFNFTRELYTHERTFYANSIRGARQIASTWKYSGETMKLVKVSKTLPAKGEHITFGKL